MAGEGGPRIMHFQGQRFIRTLSCSTSLKPARENEFNGSGHVTIGPRIRKKQVGHFITFHDHGRSTKIGLEHKKRLKLYGFPKFGKVSRGLDTILGRPKNAVSEILDRCELVEFQHAQTC